MKAIVVYNRYSGKCKAEKYIPYICETLKKKYEVVETYASQKPNSIRDYLIEHGKNYDLALAVGGDGSINEAVNGLMQLSDSRPILAYVPMGTCNDTGKTLGLKRSVKKTMEIILAGQTANLDVNKINGQYFIYGLAAGNFANASYTAQYKLKKRFGKVAYYFEVLKDLKKDESIVIRVEADGQKVAEGRFFLFLALNTRYLASFKIHRRKRIYLNNGKLFIALFKKKKKLINIFELACFLIFGEKITSNIQTLEAQRLTVSSSKAIPFTTDGEELPHLNRIEVEVLPQQIETIVAEKVLKRHFI